MKISLKIVLCALLICGAGASRASAQFYAVRIDALSLATGTLHTGMDFTVGPKLSLAAEGYWNPIRTGGLRTQFLIAQAGVRLWRFEPHTGPFLGAYAAGGTFDVGNRRHHYKGFLVGAGISYGYGWMLSERWSLTAEAGLGLYYLRDRERDYRTPWSEDETIRRSRRLVVGPSKAEVGFSYLF